MGLLRCKLFFFCLIRLWYSLCITLLAKKVYKCKDKCTVFSVHSLYNSFKDLQIRRPSLETAFDCNKICLLKLEEQRQPHTLNCPTITLSAELSCAHTLLCIWHFDSLTLCVCGCGCVGVCWSVCVCDGVCVRVFMDQWVWQGGGCTCGCIHERMQKLWFQGLSRAAHQTASLLKEASRVRGSNKLRHVVPESLIFTACMIPYSSSKLFTHVEKPSSN